MLQINPLIFQPLYVKPKLELLQETKTPDEALLKKLLDKMWDPPGIEPLKKYILQGSLDAYQFRQGLILTETLNWMRGRELRIYGMAGLGIIPKGEAVVRDLKLIARYLGCSMIGGEGIPRGWTRAAPALGFKPVSTHYLMELDNG